MSAVRDRLLELLADRATVGLDARELIELTELLVQAQDVDIAAFDNAAAAVALAGIGGHLEPIPAALAAAVEERAIAAMAALLRPASDDQTQVDEVVEPPQQTSVVAVLGWIAAAACLLLAVGAFATRPVAASRGTDARLHDKLLAVAGTVRAEWAATADPGGTSAAGEVLWNEEQQRGTMTFRGLAKNDPSRIQYQLWIFDKTRDDEYPVDGGVFDVDSETGDVVVAIHAALPVSAPTLFAITIEKPGGVVVSKREHLVLTAKLPAG